MSKFVRVLGIAALLAATIAATSVPAQARWHGGGGGWHGGGYRGGYYGGGGDRASVLVSVSARP